MKIQKHTVDQLKLGNAVEQQAVFNACYPALFRVVQRYIVHTAEAEDCVLKTMLKVFQNISDFEFKDEFGFYGWCKKIAVNEALMFVRKKHHIGLIPIDELTEDVPLQHFEHIEAKELQDAIMQLPLGFRTVFNLYVVEGYSHKEIADMLDISESTSKTQFFKAKAKLKKILTQPVYGYGRA